MEGRTTRCIECGGFVDSLNEDDDGEPCNACADRLLDTLPGVFHRPWMESWPAKDGAEADDLFADETDGEPSEEQERDPAETAARIDPDQPA